MEGWQDRRVRISRRRRFVKMRFSEAGSGTHRYWALAGPIPACKVKNPKWSSRLYYVGEVVMDGVIGEGV